MLIASSSSYDRLKTKRKRRRKRMRRRQRKRMRNLRKPSERLDGGEVAPLLCLRHCHDRPCGNRRHKRKLRITTLLHVFFFSSTFFISHFPTPNFFFFIIFKTITIQKHFFFVKHLGIDHQKKKLYRLSRAFFRLLFDVTIIFFFLFSH